MISIPIKEQTQEEIARTKIFATEVIQLLRTTPTFEVSFSKFIPAYHHYFNKQCKVIDYGFNKLIELFEAISSETVEITNSQTNDDKIIRLSYEQHLKAIDSINELEVKDLSTPDLLFDLANLVSNNIMNNNVVEGVL